MDSPGGKSCAASSMALTRPGLVEAVAAVFPDLASTSASAFALKTADEGLLAQIFASVDVDDRLEGHRELKAELDAATASGAGVGHYADPSKSIAATRQLKLLKKRLLPS